MRSPEALKEAYELLARLIADDDLFCGHAAGEPARQFVLGGAAALYWALGNENRPFREMLACMRKAPQASRAKGDSDLRRNLWQQREAQ